ncbi:MAG: hypothetical protein KJP21_06790 [Bacteroidia bacterium]|nr:hypothetical protein [Bacteroidia bacterium]
MTSKSTFEDTILDATKELILANQAAFLSIEKIAKQAQTSVKKIFIIFNSVDDISLALTRRSLFEHEKKSKKIVMLSSIEAFETLLRHDLKLIYSLEQDKVVVDEQLKKYGESFQLFNNFFEDVMPKYYIEIFKKHTSILPDRSMDIRIYAHFVIHSIFFFRKKQLVGLTSKPIDLESTTRQLIASLFASKISE